MTAVDNTARMNNHQSNAGSLTSGLKSLQSSDDIQILNVIDQLRLLGIRELELPQLVVAGSQSAGKSSVLEAISGYPFPRAEMTCTRFVTQISFRRADAEQIHVSITPDKSRNEQDRLRLQHKTFSLVNPDPAQLPLLIKDAEREIGLSGNKSFSKDVLNVQIAGPHHRPLTLVDLPGLIEVDSKNDENIQLIRSMVDEWTRQKGSIILAVVEAKNDAQTQGILSRVKLADPSGERTFGIITKPDLAGRGSDLEHFWIEHAMNDPRLKVEFPFSKGWHVLRNRNYEDLKQKSSSQIRDEKEKEFFSDPAGHWGRVDARFRGIDPLRLRLGRLLHEHTQKQLPRLRNEVRNLLSQWHNEHRDLDLRLKQPDKLWTDFKVQCREMSYITKDAVHAHVSDDHLALYRDHHTSNKLSEIYKDIPYFLRARIEEEADDFRDEIVDNGEGIDNQGIDTDLALFIDFLESEMAEVLMSTRGEHLPGHFDPSRLNLLFWEHSKRWTSIASRYIDDSYGHCSRFLEDLVRSRLGQAMPSLPQAIIARIETNIEDKFREHREKATEELDRLESDRKRQPRTRNAAFGLQSRRKKNERLLMLVVKAARANEGINAQSNNQPNGHPGITPAFIERALGSEVSTGGAAELASDMLIYYEIARDVFVDNVLVQVVERHLLQDLHQLFWDEVGVTRDEFLAQLDDDEDLRERQRRKRQLEDDITHLKRLLERL